MPLDSQELEPAGYQALLEMFDVDPLPHYRASYVARRGGRRLRVEDNREEHNYPRSYGPERSLTGQLGFALRYDGVNLGILKAVFQRCDVDELAAWIDATPTGKYTRRAWYLFEWLTGRRLDLPDLKRGMYVPVLEPERYVTAGSRNSTRHRVKDNLLGVPGFCPTVRRTKKVAAFAGKHLAERLQSMVLSYDPEVLQRAAQFLYLKETRSSFEIEREQPSRRRAARFVDLLRRAPELEKIDQPTLVRLQNAIVDPRYAEHGYRSEQNYVGQTLHGYREHVHYVCPKPGDVETLMAAFLECYRRLSTGDVDPVTRAAALAFGFVFIHPFEDGNGRLHRFLVHHVLSRAGFTPQGVVLPVSATMLAERDRYDACLESFSRPLMERVDFELDARGAMVVDGETADLYRYFDATPMVEYLEDVVEQTINRDLQGELEFLVRFDRAWQALQEIVDMPDRKVELFIRLCLANQGRLSERKRRSHFAELEDEEISEMERVVQDVIG